MVIQPSGYPFDFGRLETAVRVESKHADAPRPAPYSYGAQETLQFVWRPIKPQEFDWLVLSGLYDSQWWLWFLRSSDARFFMTGGRDCGQITYSIPRAKQRRKARDFDYSCRTTLDELRAKCEIP
jgi:hypothetical protein